MSGPLHPFADASAFDPTDVESLAELVRGGDGRLARVGAEVELWAYDPALRPLGYPGSSGTLPELLERIAAAAPGSERIFDAATEVLAYVRLPSGGLFALEPGNQIEYATPPADDVSALAEDLERGLAILQRAGGGAWFAAHGTDPAPKDSLCVVERKRFRLFHRYLASRDRSLPEAFLRLYTKSAALQPNVDMPGGRADWDDGFRLALSLSPFASMLFANSEYLEGRRRPSRCARMELVGATESRRGGIPREVFDHEDPAVGYARWVFGMDVCFLEGLPLEEQPEGGALPWSRYAAEGWRGRRASLADAAAFLSTVRCFVRPRGFLEMRTIDAPPLAELLAPVAFFAALLRDPAARADAWETLARAMEVSPGRARERRTGAAIADAWAARGLAAKEFRRPDVALSLLKTARRALEQSGEEPAAGALNAALRRAEGREPAPAALDAEGFLRGIATREPAAAAGLWTAAAA